MGIPKDGADRAKYMTVPTCPHCLSEVYDALRRGTPRLRMSADELESCALTSLILFEMANASYSSPMTQEYLIAGSIAGIVSRTFIAPIERVKILFQARRANCALHPAFDLGRAKCQQHDAVVRGRFRKLLLQIAADICTTCPKSTRSLSKHASKQQRPYGASCTFRSSDSNIWQ